MTAIRRGEAIRIDMSLMEYRQLLMAMGYAAAAAREQDGDIPKALLALANNLIAESAGLISDGVSIDELGISARARNALVRSEPRIETIEQLTGHTKWELFRLKGFGRKSLAEVEDALADRGLRLREASRYD